MVLKYNISPSTFTEDFIIRVWEANNDVIGGFVYETTLVEKDGGGVPTPGAGHQVIETVTVNGLDKVVHIVRMYGAVSATLLHEVNVEPRADIATIYAPIRFKIGDGGPNTPADGSSVYQNDLLIGFTKDEYIVNRNLYGQLIPDTHYTYDVSGGSFQLIDPDVFSGPPTIESGEEFTIQILPKAISTPVNDSVVAKWFGQTPDINDVFVDVSASRNYTYDDFRKLIRLGGNGIYNFNSNPPYGYVFSFNHSGAAGTGVINFNNAPLRTTDGGTVGTVNLESGQQAGFMFDGTVWNQVYFSAAIDANPVAGKIVGYGVQFIGDISAGDPDYIVTHNLGIAGDYLVLFSIKTNAGAGSPFPNSRIFNNDVIGTWFHYPTDQPNRFGVCFQERAAGLQDMSISWIIIKL